MEEKNKISAKDYIIIGVLFVAVLLLVGVLSFQSGVAKARLNPVTTAPIVFPVNYDSLIESGCIDSGNSDSTNEILSGLVDILSEASVVDITIKGDKNTGGIIDIHLEFDN